MALYDKTIFRRLPNPFVIFAGVLFFDQLFKQFSLSSENFHRNYGALLGAEIHPVILSISLFAFAVIAIQELKRSPKDKQALFSLALISAGIASNIADKARLGFIIDYINIPGVFSFNLADLSILFGAGFFIWRIVRE